MRCYVERFGEEGAESDTLWLLSNPGALIASSHAERIQAPQVAGDDHDAALGALYVDALASQWIVRRALQNPSILRRYYRATVWSGMLFGRTRQDVNTRFNYMLSDLGAHFNESSGDRFWRYARQVVLLVHATGRDDLLRNAKPGDLKRVYADWRRWMLGAANDLYGASSDAAAPYLHLSPDRLHWEYRKDVPVGGWQEGLPPLELPDRPFAEGQVPLSSQGLEAWALFQYEASSDMVRGKLQAIGRAEAQRQDKRH